MPATFTRSARVGLELFACRMVSRVLRCDVSIPCCPFMFMQQQSLVAGLASRLSAYMIRRAAHVLCMCTLSACIHSVVCFMYCYIVHM